MTNQRVLAPLALKIEWVRPSQNRKTLFCGPSQPAFSLSWCYHEINKLYHLIIWIVHGVVPWIMSHSIFVRTQVRTSLFPGWTICRPCSFPSRADVKVNQMSFPYSNNRFLSSDYSFVMFWEFCAACPGGSFQTVCFGVKSSSLPNFSPKYYNYNVCSSARGIKTNSHLGCPDVWATSNNCLLKLLLLRRATPITCDSSVHNNNKTIPPR